MQIELRRNGHDVVMLAESGAYSPDDFFDAFHLQWPAVQRLSAIIGEQVAVRSIAHAGAKVQ
jgi:hypothetical protein